MDTLKYPFTKEPTRSILNISPENQKIFQSLINIYNIEIRDYNIATKHSPRMAEYGNRGSVELELRDCAKVEYKVSLRATAWTCLLMKI